MYRDNKPIFSVVIPVFNKEPHVHRSISSVIGQTFEKFEIVIVDDASTDGSLKAVNQFTDSRIHTYRRKRPGPGGYAARNLGIEKSNGYWIAFLDADDKWSPHHLEEMYKLSMAFREHQFLSCGWKIVNSDGTEDFDKYTSHSRKCIPHSITFVEYLKLCINDRRPAHTSVVCIKNNSLAKMLFPDGLVSRGGDLYAWQYYLAQSKELAWSPHIGAMYHRDAVNMVTATAPYDTRLNKSIEKDFGRFVGDLEMRLLKKFSNRQVFKEWLRHRLMGQNPYNLASNFYWYGDIIFCLVRIVAATLPTSGLRIMVQCKGALRQLANWISTTLNFR